MTFRIDIDRIDAHMLSSSRMSFRLLLIEDDDGIAEYVAQGLREEGFLVQRAANGHDGEREMASQHWDLIILDWWLPGPEGLVLLEKLRTADQATPVLFLTARDGVQERVRGCAGADDYLCKPFAFDELLARIEALIRRTRTKMAAEWHYADVVLDISGNRTQRAGYPLTLTAREQSLLLFFLRHPGQTLSRSVLYEQVWHEEYDGLSNTLEMHVMELGAKLEAFGPRIIHTVRGQGYRFRVIRRRATTHDYHESIDPVSALGVGRRAGGFFHHPLQPDKLAFARTGRSASEIRVRSPRGRHRGASRRR